MHSSTSIRIRRMPHRPLAGALAACLLMATPIPGLAADWVVTNCNDSGEFSLRDVLEHKAQDGDTVDLSHLICGTISLTTGAIEMEQNNLPLVGPENVELRIEGGPEYPWFEP